MFGGMKQDTPCESKEPTMNRLVSEDETRDGRPWGQGLPEKVVKYTREGKKYRKVTKDSWEGPDSYDPDQEHYHPTGQYVRIARTYDDG
jgi:hypothetical protein